MSKEGLSQSNSTSEDFVEPSDLTFGGDLRTKPMEVVQRMSEGIGTISSLQKFLKARIAMEEHIGHEIQKLGSKVIVVEDSALGEAIKSLPGLASSLGKQHIELHKQLSKIEKSLADFKAPYIKKKEEKETLIIMQVNELERLRNEVEFSKRKYYAKHMEQQATEKSWEEKEATGRTPKKELDKISRKWNQLNTATSVCRDEYIACLDAFNLQLVPYHDHLFYSLNDMQELEEQRIEFIRDVLQRVIFFQQASVQAQHQANSAIGTRLDLLSSNEETASFIKSETDDKNYTLFEEMAVEEPESIFGLSHLREIPVFEEKKKIIMVRKRRNSILSRARQGRRRATSEGDLYASQTKVAKPLLEAAAVTPSVKRRSFRKREYAIALFDFQGAAEDELKFAKGDIIEIYEALNDQWYCGKFEEKVGIFPNNHVQVVNNTTIFLKSASSVHSSAESDLDGDRSIKTESPQEPENKRESLQEVFSIDSNSEEEDVVISESDDEGVNPETPKLETIIEEEEEEHTLSTSGESEVHSEEEIGDADVEGEPVEVFVNCIYDFIPENVYELGVKEGEEGLTLIKSAGDWCLLMNAKGDRGMTPRSFLEIVEEKEYGDEEYVGEGEYYEEEGVEVESSGEDEIESEYIVDKANAGVEKELDSFHMSEDS